MDTFKKKLRTSEANPLHLLFPPDDFELENGEAHFEVNSLPNDCKWLMVFVDSKAERDACLAHVHQALAEQGIVWWAFQKKRKGLSSDISRDNILDGMREWKFKYFTLVSLDSKWSAFGMQKQAADYIPKPKVRLPQFPEYIDNVARTVTLPTELAAILKPEPEAMAFFEGISFTNRKEYVVWILSAKRDETKKKRLEKSLTYLLEGRKNPTERPRS